MCFIIEIDENCVKTLDYREELRNEIELCIYELYVSIAGMKSSSCIVTLNRGVLSV